ncbi:unnamed protein product [Boreogadus saida]
MPRHGLPWYYFPADLRKAKFVFNQHKAHRSPLQPPYNGPFSALEPMSEAGLTTYQLTWNWNNLSLWLNLHVADVLLRRWPQTDPKLLWLVGLFLQSTPRGSGTGRPSSPVPCKVCNAGLCEFWGDVLMEFQ